MARRRREAPRPSSFRDGRYAWHWRGDLQKPREPTVAAGYGHNVERANAFADDYEKFLGVRPSLYHGNVASAEDCRRTIGEVIDQHGRLDILVNNAGITVDKTVAKMTDVPGPAVRLPRVAHPTATTRPVCT